MPKIIVKINCEEMFCDDCELHMMKPRHCMAFSKPLEFDIKKTGIHIPRLPECLAAEKMFNMAQEIINSADELVLEWMKRTEATHER